MEILLVIKIKKVFLYIKQKLNKKRNKNSNKEIKLRKKMGRKNKNDTSRGKHDKNAPDNIIKKCKRIFFEYAVIYINYIFKNYRLNKQRDFVFKKLDYKKNVDTLKKDEEMKLFNMSLKDVVSLEISSKYSLANDKKINK